MDYLIRDDMQTQSFDGKSQQYEMGRPEVCLDALEYLLSIIPTNAVIAEMGAGTGKFTSLIAERGYNIYAVEPNDEMRKVLSDKLHKFPNVMILNTCAECTNIPYQSVDVVVAVTALHWFDLNAFRIECHRILKPGGIVVAIYNSRKSELLKVANDPTAKMETKEFFKGKCDIVEFPNPLYYTIDKFIAYHLSHSSAPRPSDHDYITVINNLNSKFNNHSINGKYLFDFVTIMYISNDFTVKSPPFDTD